MALSKRKWFREVADMARELGINDVRVVHKTRHPHVVGTYRGRTIERAFACSPSSAYIALRKTRCQLERMIGCAANG